MSRILITGGTGTLGKSLTSVLSANNISFTVGSRTNRSGAAHIAVMDLLENKGLKEAVAGKEIIFHLATDMERDTEITRNLLQAIGTNTQVYLIYISIVGVDKIPFAYYKQKLASEEAIRQSGIAYSILRATQFHEFIYEILSKLLKYPVGLLPKKVISQPIQTALVAKELYRLSLEKPANRIYEIGGVADHTFEEIASEWMHQTGKKRLIVNLPVWGKLGRTFRQGALTTPNKIQESVTWSDWLSRKV